MMKDFLVLRDEVKRLSASIEKIVDNVSEQDRRLIYVEAFIDIASRQSNASGAATRRTQGQITDR